MKFPAEDELVAPKRLSNWLLKFPTKREAGDFEDRVNLEQEVIAVRSLFAPLRSCDFRDEVHFNVS